MTNVLSPVSLFPHLTQGMITGPNVLLLRYYGYQLFSGGTAGQMLGACGWNLLTVYSLKLNDLDTTSFVFTQLANTMKYGGGFLYNLVFTEWRHCVSQNEVWGRGCYIILFSPSDVTAFHRIWKIIPAKHNVMPNFRLMSDQSQKYWLNIKPTMGHCLVFTPTVFDVEPTLYQHCVKSDVKPTLGHCPAYSRRWANVVLTLGHRLRRLPNVKTTLAQRLVFAGCLVVTGFWHRLLLLLLLWWQSYWPRHPPLDVHLILSPKTQLS